MKCPGCAAEVKLPRGATRVTCPKCLRTFKADDPEVEEEKPAQASVSRSAQITTPLAEQSGPLRTATKTAPAKRPPPPDEDDSEEKQEQDEQEADLASWVSPWGCAAFATVTLALLQASWPGVRGLTILLAVAAGAITALGLQRTQEERRTADRVWFSVSGALSGVVLLLTVFLPGLLNKWWAIDTHVRKADPNKQMRVPLDKPLDKGRSLSKSEWVDSASEAIRQDDVFVCVVAAKLGKLPGKDRELVLQVQLRLVNSGESQAINLEGFAKAPPKLRTEPGAEVAYLEQRLRKPDKGAPVFEEPAAWRTAEVPSKQHQDVLLIFAAPPGEGALQLELPASAWGRKGTLKFRVPKFDPPPPDPKEGVP
jgi:LSD1 subclass zinc finger protein